MSNIVLVHNTVARQARIADRDGLYTRTQAWRLCMKAARGRSN